MELFPQLSWFYKAIEGDVRIGTNTRQHLYCFIATMEYVWRQKPTFH